MSVKRKVTIPAGGARGMTGVDGSAIMTVQSTKPRGREDDKKAARSSVFWLLHGSAGPGEMLQ
jgi:hypothetical protein